MNAVMDKKRPNWLLRGFIVASAAVHALLLVEMSGLYASKDITPIEISLDAPQQPSARNIPVPPQRPKTPPPTDPQEIKAPKVVAMTPPPRPSAAPTLDPTPSPVSEAISVPDRPPIEKPGVVAWAAPGPVGTGTAGVSPYGTREDYYGMVRLQIEKKKRYPSVAVKRQIEGRVRLRFVLDQNGMAHNISIVEKSRHEILDQAALEAVKAASPFPTPPARLFDGQVLLDIVIAFELT
jgi:periplasmic protein TonB